MRYVFLAIIAWLHVWSAQAQSNLIPFQTVRMSYSSTNVTTSAWVQLVSSLTQSAQRIEVFDSSGRTLQLGLGGSGSEQSYFYITPGGNGDLGVTIRANSRISLKAVSGTANSGEIIINFYKL